MVLSYALNSVTHTRLPLNTSAGIIPSLSATIVYSQELVVFGITKGKLNSKASTI